MKMVKYCPRCGKEFPFQCHVLRHIKRKKLCETTFLNVSPEEVEKNFVKFQKLFQVSIEAKNNTTENDKNVAEKCSRNWQYCK